MVFGKVSVGFSPNAPEAVGISDFGAAGASTVAAGIAGPRFAAALTAAEPDVAPVAAPVDVTAADDVDVGVEVDPQAVEQQ